MSIRTHTILPPDVPRGYELEFWQFFVVIPEDTRNLFTNPSIERATTGHNAVGAGTTIARSTEEQWAGAYSLKVTPGGASVTEGWRSGTVDLTAGTVYTMSTWFKGRAGRQYLVAFFDTTTPVFVRQFTFYATGYWQRIVITEMAATTTTHALRIQKAANASDTTPFHVDAVQCEAKAYATDYCDGDMMGFVLTRPDFLWVGAPHASQSTRSAQSRAGGREVRLKDYGFLLMTILGLGMAPFVNSGIPSGFRGGGSYQRSVYVERPFSLIGDLRKGTPRALDAARAELVDLFKFSVTDPPQPLLLRARAQDCDTVALSDPIDIPCLFEAPALGATMDTAYQERVELRFKQYFPLLMNQGWRGATLGFTSTVTDANHLIKRGPTGTWANLGGTGPSDDVYVVKKNPVNGKLYIGGAFATVGGNANMSRIVEYDPDTGTYAALGTGANAGAVTDLDFRANGNVIVVGSFTQINGVANTVRIAEYNITTGTWSAFGTGITGGGGVVNAVVVDSINAIYATGSFTTANGGAAANIVRINSDGTFTALGTGLNSSGEALTVGADGRSVFVGGNFTDAGGVSGTNYIAVYRSGSTWTALRSGLSAAVLSLARGLNGDIFAGGSFVTNYTRVVRWNGSDFFAMGDGLNNQVQGLFVDPVDGSLYAVGAFIATGTRALIDSVARWNGSIWHTLDADLPGAQVFAVYIDPDRTLYLGFSTTGSAGTAVTTTVQNAGSADTWPVMELVGPGQVVALRNFTTSREILFNLTLLSGERATLDLNPANVTFVSTFRGDISSLILPGSDDANFFLQAKDAVNQGNNAISLFITGSTDSNTGGALRWRERYGSLAEAIQR